MRYLPLTPDDRTAMLAVIGAQSIDDLFVDVPAGAGATASSTCRSIAGELEVERALSALAATNVRGGIACRSSAARGPIATMCRRPSTT